MGTRETITNEPTEKLEAVFDGERFALVLTDYNPGATPNRTVILLNPREATEVAAFIISNYKLASAPGEEAKL